VIAEINPGSGTRRSWLQRFHLDGMLLLALLAACALGLVVLYSATGESQTMMQRQFVRLALAFGTMIVIAQIPPQILYRWTPWLFGAGVALLAAVLAVGDIGKGAQRWLDLGFVRFQPSEMMKLAMPMMLAWYFADVRLPPSPLRLIVSAVLIAIPTLLIMRQPDLGTALLIGCAGFFVLFLAGIYWRLLFGLAAVGAACAPILWYFMHDYQRQRVITFLDPEQDPLGSGYHIIQSKIALGSGGLFGKGWLNGSQAHLQFLPEGTTDFIFAVYGEEFGLIGLLLLLGIYFAVTVRGLQIAGNGQNGFERLLAASLSFTFLFYVLVNTGMVSGVLPVVGVPLPLISYGGTSMVTLLAGFGMLMSIQTHKKMLAP